MVEDLEQLLRAQVSVAALQDTCQALAAVALSSPPMSKSIETFCESIYGQLMDLLAKLTGVRCPSRSGRSGTGTLVPPCTSLADGPVSPTLWAHA